MKKTLFYFILGFMIWGCAIVVEPSGGEKDVAPPKALREIPENFSTAFNYKSILIHFDEFIKLQNPSQNIIISPPMEKDPDFVLKGKRLFINLKSELKPNTTYSINFGNTIQDFHEGNPIPNYKYVFSTGSYIDSLQINGSVLYAFDKLPAKKVKILLHENLQDSAIRTVKPYAFTFSSEDGSFVIDYLKKGDYKIFAIEDANNNYLYDEGEGIGFWDSVIQLSSNINFPPIRMFKETAPEVRIKNSKLIKKGRLEIYFSKRVDSLQIKNISNPSSKQWNLLKWNKEKDSLTYWFDPKLLHDSLSFEANFDSKKDTVNVFAPKTEGKDDSLFVFKSNAEKKPLKPGQKLVLKFPDPVLAFDTSLIIFEEDSLRIRNYKLTQKGNSLTEAVIDFNFLMEKNYKFSFLNGAFIDFYNKKNKSKEIAFQVLPQEKFSLLELVIETRENETANLIIQLLLNDKINRESVVQKKPGKVEFKTVDPGKYRVKVILDENGNGKWDPGNLELKKQPEEVYYYPETLTLRENWELKDIKFEIPPNVTDSASN